MPPPIPQLDGVDHRHETVNGVRVHYAEAGAGEPLLLLHGWPQHWWMWRDYIGPLAERFRVIVPDLRGHGWSDKPRSSYLKSELRDDQLALLDALGIERARWVGHDWGAVAALLAALESPERVERLVVMSIPHPWTRRTDPRVFGYGTYQLVLAGPAGKLVTQRLGFTRLMLKAGRSAGSFSDEEVETYASVFREPDAAEATVHLYRSFLLHELLPLRSREMRRARLTVPTLWLFGEKDPLARVSDDAYRDHADDMVLERIPGANHFLPEELPQTVLDRLRAFL